MKVEEKWAFVSRLVKAKAMQDEPSEIMKNIYALVKDKEYFVVTSNAEDHFVPAGFEADSVFEMEGKLNPDLSVLQESPFTDKGSVVEIFTDLTVWMGIKKVIDQINANAVA